MHVSYAAPPSSALKICQHVPLWIVCALPTYSSGMECGSLLLSHIWYKFCMFLNSLQKAMTRAPNQINCARAAAMWLTAQTRPSLGNTKKCTTAPRLMLFSTSIVFPVCNNCYSMLAKRARKQANQQPAAPIPSREASMIAIASEAVPETEESMIAIASELVPETPAPATIDKEHCGRRHTRSKPYRPASRGQTSLISLPTSNMTCSAPRSVRKRCVELAITTNQMCITTVFAATYHAFFDVY